MLNYDYFETSRTYAGVTYRADCDGVAYLATTDTDFAYEFDGCGAAVAAPEKPLNSDVPWLPEVGACPNGCCARGAWKMVARLWNGPVADNIELRERDYMADQLDLLEHAEQVVEQASELGIGVVFMCPDYHGSWVVSPLPNGDDLTTWLIIVDEYSEEAAIDYAKMMCAYRNGETWTVGSMPVEYADELGEDANAFECGDTISGLVWENVDERGASTPSEEELIKCV